MKIFFDTEFTGLHKDTTLISIGCISANGRTFYAEFSDYNKSQCDKWIHDNVISNLKFKEPKDGEQEYYVARKNTNEKYSNSPDNSFITNYSVEFRGNKEMVRKELTIWLQQFETVEFVSDCSHYDFVLLVDIFGTAFDLPKNVCPACHDINQDIARYYDISETDAFNVTREQILDPENDTTDKHNALHDAEVIRDIYGLICNGTV